MATAAKILEEIDPLDQKILKELINNSKQSISSIAESVGISRKSCERRIKTLEKSNIITGYTIKIKETNKEITDVHVLIELSIKNRLHIDKVLQAIINHKCVSYIGKISGSWDLLVVSNHSSKSDFSNLLNDIESVDEVENTLSFFVVEDLLIR